MVLEVKGVSAGYGETQVLREVSLGCKDKSLTVIVGPNGSGKSTALKAVNGLIRPWTGSITYNGEDITNLLAFERVERGIASVPEGRRIFPLLSTEENLRLGAYSRRARGSAEETMKYVYSLFPRLKERVAVKTGRLSGGEQQMVAIGRALMTKPSLLVLDEPSLGIAPKLVAEIFDKIKELTQTGLSVLMVEQNVYRALSVANYAYVLQMGAVINAGTPSELMNVEELRRAYFSIT